MDVINPINVYMRVGGCHQSYQCFHYEGWVDVINPINVFIMRVGGCHQSYQCFYDEGGWMSSILSMFL